MLDNCWTTAEQMLDKLPLELLQRLCEDLNQDDTTALMFTCRATYAAIRHPHMWRALIVRNFSESVVRFVDTMAVRTLSVMRAFTHSTVAGLGQLCTCRVLALRDLTIQFLPSPYLPGATIAAVLAPLSGLRSLSMMFTSLEQDADLELPHLPELRHLSVIDKSDVSNVIVSMGEMPRIASMFLECYTSDVLDFVPRYPELRSLVYRSVEEDYSTARLSGATFDALTLDVHDDGRRLKRCLARCACVDELSLGLRIDEFALDAALPVRSYCFLVRDLLSVLTIDRAALVGGMVAMTVHFDPQEDIIDLDERFSIHFAPAAPVGDWAAFLQRLAINVPATMSFDV